MKKSIILFLFLICLSNINAVDNYVGLDNYNYEYNNTYSEVYKYHVYKTPYSFTDLTTRPESEFDWFDWLSPRDFSDFFYTEYSFIDAVTWNRDHPDNKIINLTLEVTKWKENEKLFTNLTTFYPEDTIKFESIPYFIRLYKDEYVYLRFNTNYESYQARQPVSFFDVETHIPTTDDFAICKFIQSNIDSADDTFNEDMDDQTSLIYTYSNSIVSKVIEIALILLAIVNILIFLLIIWLIITSVLLLIKLVRGK